MGLSQQDTFENDLLFNNKCQNVTIIERKSIYSANLTIMMDKIWYNLNFYKQKSSYVMYIYIEFHFI